MAGADQFITGCFCNKNSNPNNNKLKNKSCTSKFWSISASVSDSETVLRNGEKRRTGGRSSVLRGTESVPKGRDPAKRYTRRSHGNSDSTNDLSGYSRSLQLRLLWQFRRYPSQVLVTFPGFLFLYPILRDLADYNKWAVIEIFFKELN